MVVMMMMMMMIPMEKPCCLMQTKGYLLYFWCWCVYNRIFSTLFLEPCVFDERPIVWLTPATFINMPWHRVSSSSLILIMGISINWITNWIKLALSLISSLGLSLMTEPDSKVVQVLLQTLGHVSVEASEDFSALEAMLNRSRGGATGTKSLSCCWRHTACFRLEEFRLELD